ncbi:hypothetical protein CKA32_006292 [Geitlerinema sp. FC II]|nr:hypothetical protein CKA32_006292 [Geitlerinema sp. FC II]
MVSASGGFEKHVRSVSCQPRSISTIFKDEMNGYRSSIKIS